MYQIFVSNLPFQRRLPCRMLLCIAWILGLACGMIYAYHASDRFFAMMRSAAEGSVSIVGMFVIYALPFLLSAFAVFISRRELLIPLAFLKAFSFSAILFSFELAFCSAGWIIRLLVMLPDLVAMPLLLYYWFRCLEEERSNVMMDLAICAGFIGLLVFFESCFISPFLAMIV